MLTAELRRPDQRVSSASWLRILLNHSLQAFRTCGFADLFGQTLHTRPSHKMHRTRDLFLAARRCQLQMSDRQQWWKDRRHELPIRDELRSWHPRLREYVRPVNHVEGVYLTKLFIKEQTWKVLQAIVQSLDQPRIDEIEFGRRLRRGATYFVDQACWLI